MSGSRHTADVARLRIDIHRCRLSNGLTLLAARRRAAPTLAVACAFEVSPINEPPRQGGVANLVGETLDEGTERYTGEQLAELIEGLGGHLQTGTNGASVQLAAEDAKTAVRILAEVLRRPRFPPNGVRRARELVIADIKADLDDPRTVASQHFRQLVYGRHPFARPAKGEIDVVRAMRPAQLRRFHAQWFTPDNAILVAVGDVEPGKIFDLLEKSFGTWRGKCPPLPTVEEPSPPPRPVHKHVPYDRAQVQVFLGHLGVRRTDPDFYKLLVMDHVLGSGPGFTSRIARKLRDEQGLCYAVGAGITSSAGRERGMFSAYMGTSPSQVKVAIEGFLREMRAIREGLPTPAELEDVKAYLTGSFVWGLERNGNLASFLLRAERFQLGDDYVERFPHIIESVTAEDVRDVAARHLDPDRYFTVTLGP